MTNRSPQELLITSDGFFDLESQPAKVAVLGAGYVAVELAGIFHGLGSDAHLLFRGDSVLRKGFDPFITSALMASLLKNGPVLHPRSAPARISRGTDAEKGGGKRKLVVETTDGQRHKDFDCIVCAIGRTPATAGLGLEAAGVALDPSGRVLVDKFQTTSATGVYALGDASSSGFELTPVAIAAGRRLADRLFGGAPSARLEYADIATVVFSHPPLGTVGLTEPAARAAFPDEVVAVKEATFASMGYALNDGDDAKVRRARLVMRGANLL
jgi:glutathione reductase (NADPH)